MIYWATLFVAIATSMAGQTLLKAGAGATQFVAQLLDWRTLFGFVLYGGAAVLYIVALRRIPMSRALPCTAISYVAAALIGRVQSLGVTVIAAFVIGVIQSSLGAVGSLAQYRTTTPFVIAIVVLLWFGWPGQTQQRIA